MLVPVGPVLSLWWEYAVLQNSLLRGALKEGTLNMKIHGDSKSQRDDVSVHFKTRTKCWVGGFGWLGRLV